MSAYPPRFDKVRKAWLASLKDGDEVAITGSRGPLDIDLVSKVHESWAPIAFRLKRGYHQFGVSGKELECRRDLPADYLVPVTDEIRDWIRRGRSLREWRQRMSNYNWGTHGTVTDEQIEAIAKILGWSNATNDSNPRGETDNGG